MTTSYEDTGEFVAAVRRLADPLSDPLPSPSSAPRTVTSADSVDGAQPESKPEGFPESGLAEQEVPPSFRPPGASPAEGRGREVPPGGKGPARPESKSHDSYDSYTSYASYEYKAAYTGETAYQQSVRNAWQSHDAYAQPYAPAYESQSQSVPRLAPEAVPAPRRGRSDLAQTAQFPAVEADQAPEQMPVPGGRAARRKAAKRGQGQRSASPPRPATASPTPADNTAVPRTRMEARRAARAAKDPPMVVVSRITGEAFITIGVVMLLFVVYQLWWTNVLADEAANGAANNLKHQWAGASATSDAHMPNHFAEGQTFAIIYLPKLDVSAPIAEGVDKDTVLDKGEVGHYSGSLETAFPWDKTGNFALAAHRNTHGEPFRYINKLVPGDKVVVETSSTYYTYEITSTLPQTSPANTRVIQPVPQESGFTKPGRYITLTTCTPEFTSLYRLIVWGKMVDEQPRSKGTPAALAR